jgi:ornithine carrier protein
MRATIYHPDVYPSTDDLPLPALLACGATAGAFASFLLTPIELVKCKMQVPLEPSGATAKPPGPLKIIASVYLHQGLRGYWHGQLGTLIRETGGSAAWFGANEGTKILFRKFGPSSRLHRDESLPIWQQMTAGAFAGMSYNFVFYPADTIKSQMQTEDVSKMTGGRRSFGAVGKALWRQHGIRGFYRGCGITVARAAPSSAFIFTIYEGLVQRWP